MKKRYRRGWITTLLIVLLSVGVFSIGHIIGKHNNQPEITSSLIKNKMTTAKELTTTKYLYTNVGAFEDSNQFNGWDIPLTGKKFIVSYDGVIHTGVDLANAEVELKGKDITIHLPEPTILSHEINEESFQVFDQKNSIFNPIKVEDYSAFVSNQKEEVEKEALEKGLLKEANKQAQEAVREIVNLTIPDNDYKIEFK